MSRTTIARFGFTIIEVFVAIVVISLLVTLIVAAVVQATATSRKLSCESNLRQLGIAVTNYESSFAVLPCMGVLGGRYLARDLGGAASSAEAPPNWGLPCWPDSPEPCGPADWQRPTIYVCPADSFAGRNQRAMNYFFNGGKYLTRPSGVSLGPSGETLNPRLSFRDITDGLSQTALASERLFPALASAGSWEAAANLISDGSADREPLRYLWRTTLPVNPATNPDDFLQECALRNINPQHLLGSVAFDYANMPYLHVQTPNRKNCMVDLDGSFPATSLHHAGVNLLHCDGHVEFISENVDLRVWHDLGTASSKE